MEANVSQRKRLYLTYGHIQPFINQFTASGLQTIRHISMLSTRWVPIIKLSREMPMSLIVPQ
jgi:hypothetical protein